MKTLRWGVVGTGGIANWMAHMIKLAEFATLTAVSSRRMETAQEFAAEHGVLHLRSRAGQSGDDRFR